MNNFASSEVFMNQRARPLDMPRLELEPVIEIARPESLVLLENPGFKPYRYGRAHAFISLVENVRVIDTGYLVTDEGIVVHGVTSGNYESNIEGQLRDYQIQDGGELKGEYVLIWGRENFGHWLLTYTMRATLLFWAPELLGKTLLIKEGLPKRYIEWLQKMGFRYFVFGRDGVKVKTLWVPSVVTYRGHYDDQLPYVFPQSLDLMRSLILKKLQLPTLKRERIYISRAKAKWRNLENEEEVASFLEKNRIRRVFMEDLSVDEQLQLISRCELVVVHCGGGSAITMFAPKDCKIVEINVPDCVATFASRCWAHMLGQKFLRYDATPTKQTGTLPIDMDSVVDLNKLGGVLWQ